jgi:IS30 family transposase
MKNALAATINTLPEQLRRSVTWDRGKELSAHAAFKIETGVSVFFADPHSPWQRGTNENTNGLQRQYFPKGTDLSRWSAEEIEAVAAALNNRPRKDARLKDTSRSPQRAATVTATSRCCDHLLSPVCTP